MHRQLLSAMVFMVLTAAAALTAGMAAAEVQTMEEIVVTATGTEVPRQETATSTTVFVAPELEARQDPRVSSFLREVPGAALSQTGSRGGTTSLLLRGGNSNMTLVLLNGFRLNDTGGFFDFSKLTLDNVERLEVVRGPMSSLYGNDAMTGVVQLFTRQGSGPPRLTAASLWGAHAEGHSRNNLISEQRLSLLGSEGVFSYSLAYGRYDDPGILAFNNRFASNVVNSRFDLEPLKNLKFTLSQYYVDTYFGFPTFSGDRFDPQERGGLGLDPDQNQKSRLLLLGLTTRYVPLPWWENELQLGFLHTTLRYHNPANPREVLFQAFDFFSRDQETQWTAHYRAHLSFGARERLAGTTTLGVELRHARYEGWSRDWDWLTFSGYQESTNVAHRGSVTWYFQEQLAFRERLFLNLGASLEDNRAFQKLEFCPRASTAVRLPETDTTLRAAGGRAVKAPSFLETNSLNPFFRGNPKLNPEKNISWEVGVDQWLWQGRLRAGLTYFENHFTDLIQYVQTGFSTGTFENIAAARTKGIEAYIQTKPYRGMSLRASYTRLTQFKVLDDGGITSINIITGKNLLRRPRQTFSFDLGYARGPVELNFHGLYVGMREDRRPSFLPPYFAARERRGGYFTADLAASYTVLQDWGRIRKLQLLARANNLFDRDYEEVFGYSSPRFQILGGLRLEI